MNNKITRKQFTKLLMLTATVTGITALTGYGKFFKNTFAQIQNIKNYLPLVPGSNSSSPIPSSTLTPTSTATPTPTTTPGNKPKVVHVHNNNATSWDFSTGWYGDFVNQQAVNQMVDEGIKILTEKSDIAEAWDSLLTGYQYGMAIAIKVNFNNSFQCEATENIIDALMEPVNALIRGMLVFGVREMDIWVYDAVRYLPTRFRSKCIYPGIRFFDQGCSELATFNSNDPNAWVTFQEPNLSPRRVCDVIANASYLINMPIIKDHGTTGVTLGFKNHFGTIDKVVSGYEDDLHYYINPSDWHYRSDYNPLVEIFKNTHIVNKTILTIGDGLFGALGAHNTGPWHWQSFGNISPDSLFLSTDPVAIDCVMLDILDAEPVFHPQRPGAENYLKLASEAFIGVYERGDPWGNGYSKINYLKIELT